MAIVLRKRMPVIAALSYAAIVGCLFTLAVVTTDEFGYRFIPAIFATYPLSVLLDRGSGFLFPVLLGGAVNSLLLFTLLKGVLYLAASKKMQ